jgi:hypothetical protein
MQSYTLCSLKIIGHSEKHKFFQRWHQAIFPLAHFPHVGMTHSHLENCIEFESTIALTTTLRCTHLLQICRVDSVLEAKTRIMQQPLLNILV